MSGSLLPEIPEEIRAARIGTCFDPITRRLLVNINAIDPGRLPEIGSQFVNGSAQLMVRSNATKSQNANQTYYGASATIKTPFAAIEASAAISNSSAENESALNCFCSYIYSGQHIRLMKLEPETLYKCMTDDFQKYYDAVVTSQDSKTYLKNYFAFIQRFGYGCVTRLDLTSGSAFQMDVRYSDSSAASSSKYRLGGSISTPVGGGAIAAEFAENITKADSKASMILTEFDTPENTPTKEWCKGIRDAVMQMGFAELAKKPQAIAPYNGEGAKSPDLPKGELIKKEKPKPKKSDFPYEDMKKELMKEDDFKGTWDEYVKEQQKAYEELKNRKKMVEDVLNENYRCLNKPGYGINNSENIGNIDESHSDEACCKCCCCSRCSCCKCSCFNATCDCKKDSTAIICEDENIKEIQTWDFSEGSQAASWNLGGYIPCDFQVTPWKELFPDLASLDMPVTFTSIYISKIYIYYYTKLEFLGYLTCLADIPIHVEQHEGAKTDLAIYRKFCSDFLNYLKKTVDSEKIINAKTYEKVVDYFENHIQNLIDTSKFIHGFIYESFFKNYEFFSKNSYGLIRLDKEIEEYFAEEAEEVKYKELKRPVKIIPLLKDAIRQYPFFTERGGLRQYSYTKKYGWNAHTSINLKEVTIDGFRAYQNYNEIYLGVGSDEIPGDVDIEIRGVPMFHNMPFDVLEEFCNPKAFKF